MANTKLPARLLDTSAIPALNVTGDLTVDTTTLKVDSTNNRVGIGTAAATSPFEIASAGGYNLHFSRGNSTPGGTDPWLGLFNNTNIANATYGWGLYDSGTDGSLQLWNKNNSTTGYDVITFARGGNVGIGTASPGYQLHIAGGGDFLVEDTGNGSAHIRLRSSSGGTASSNWKLKTSSNNFFYIDNDTGSAGTAIAINNTGNVGIGASTPTQKLDVAGTALVENTKLKAIGKSTSDTAVKVFVYDTRKDSDGGAWRKRTQHTTWYNETLNTSTRGSRREFPSVAIIIASSTTITIRDGDDPDMPMWMIFEAGGWNTHALSAGQTFTGISAKNGTLSATQTAYGYKMVNFISEHAEFRELGYNRHLAGGLVNRNGGMNAGPEFDTSKQLPADDCKDVDITVLPNAPIDITTGLPTPTIAVATTSGICVIKDDGTVVDITTGSGGYNSMHDVNISSDGYVAWASNDNRSLKSAPIPSADTAYSFWSYNQGIYNYYESHSFADNLGNVPYLQTPGGGNRAIIHGKAVSSSDGLTMIGLQGRSQKAGVYGDNWMPLVSYITSNYNTGWMLTGNKLAALSDTSTTSATGPELVANGTTFSNTSGWSGSAASLSVSSGELVVTGTATSAQNQSAGLSSISCAVGDQFLVSFDITGFVANQSSAGIITGGATIRKNSNNGYWYPNSVGTHSTVVDATGTSFTLYLHAGTAVGVITKFDNISIHKLNELDRSHNNNNLRVSGTMAKTVVESGAELVGYGPFSGSNYIEQPYTSDLDFNTGHFSTCFWTYNSASASEYIWDRADGNGNYRIALYLSNNNNGSMNMYTRDGSQYTEVTGIIGTPNKWAQVWCIRRGTSHEIWVNGIQKVATTGTVRDVSSGNGEANLHIGTRYNKVAHNTGKISLLRIYNVAPTEEQIKKIYNDERQLFHTNAKATLYGSSNDPLAIAHDDDQDILHVGTSAGRSDFQGLIRVNNTTDAVGATISASNGFIVED